MREAPALAGVTGKPPHLKAHRRKKQPARGGGATSLVGRAFARPGVTIAGAVFAALMTGVVANALFFQTGHRPAPLFNAGPGPVSEPAKLPPAVAASPPVAATVVQPPVAPPTPAPAVPQPAPKASMPATAPSKAAVHVASSAKAKPKAAHQPHVDGIGQLLGAKPAKTAAQAAPKPNAGAAPGTVAHPVAKPAAKPAVKTAKPQAPAVTPAAPPT